jgi:uncharacterized protein
MMKTRELADTGGLRTFVVVFEAGDEAFEGLTRFSEEYRVTAASFTAIGAFSSATLAYFDPDVMDYWDIPVTEQVEVLSLIGDVALSDGTPEVHAHVVLGRRDGSTIGGHLKRAEVFPTLEVVLTETPAHLWKRFDATTGLTLIDPDQSSPD